MSENEKPNDDLLSELFALGGNLSRLARTAWRESGPERRRLQQELETALTDLTRALEKAGAEFRASATGQQLEAELGRLRERVRGGGLDAVAHEEMTALLRRLNEELARAAEKLKRTPDDPAGDSA
jgi:hypothetical protein